MSFNLEGYKPEAVKEGERTYIKSKGLNCHFNYLRVGPIKNKDGETICDDVGKPMDFVDYELEIDTETDDQGNTVKGRKFWKKYNLDDEKTSGKANKTPVQKLADALFTLGYEFSNKEELEKVCAELVEKSVSVSAYYFDDKQDPDRKVQMHTLKMVNPDGPDVWEEEKTEAPSF
jgi:hypothetical protein